MSSAKPTCFSYPMTVVIVDDNVEFLENLPDNLSPKYNYKTFASPDQALDYLNQHQQDTSHQNALLTVTDDLTSGQTLGVDITKIRTIMQDTKRYARPCVLVVDHDMPQMSGFDFCQNRATHSLKKIMLTGVADHRLAIDAFNNHIIDQFVSKRDPKLFDVLDHAIATLHHNYFADVSAPIINNITASTQTLLNNTEFQSFFSAYCRQHHIREYYLADHLGSFLMIDQRNHLSWLAIQSDQEIGNYHSLAVEQDAPSHITCAIADKAKLLCLLDENDFNQSVGHWEKHLHPATPLPGLPGCYYAEISLSSVKEGCPA